MFAFASLGENYFAAGALAGLASAFSLPSPVRSSATRPRPFTRRASTARSSSAFLFTVCSFRAPEITTGGVPLILAIAFSVVLLGRGLRSFVRTGAARHLDQIRAATGDGGFPKRCGAIAVSGPARQRLRFDHNVPFTQVPAHWTDIKPLSVIIAAITFAAMWNSRKLLRRCRRCWSVSCSAVRSIISASCSALARISGRSSPMGSGRTRVHRLSLFFRTQA